MSKRFSREQIDKITFRIPSLDHAQRELVRRHLYALHDRADGMLYKESLREELLALLHEHQISDIDYHAIRDAFFG